MFFLVKIYLCSAAMGSCELVTSYVRYHKTPEECEAATVSSLAHIKTGKHFDLEVICSAKA
jgi:hypothetical protein